MPQLSSGRHFGISSSGFMGVLESGSDTQKYALAMTYRLEIQKPADLLRYTGIAYFDTSQGEQPPSAPRYDSGLTIGDVLDGKSDWSEQEVAELNEWLDANPQVDDWLQQEFDRVDAAIRASNIWSDGYSE